MTSLSSRAKPREIFNLVSHKIQIITENELMFPRKRTFQSRLCPNIFYFKWSGNGRIFLEKKIAFSPQLVLFKIFLSKYKHALQKNAFFSGILKFVQNENKPACPGEGWTVILYSNCLLNCCKIHIKKRRQFRNLLLKFQNCPSQQNLLHISWKITFIAIPGWFFFFL